MKQITRAKTLPHHKYSPVAVSVNAPQLDIGLGSDCGRPRSAVDQGQLSEAAALSDAGHPFIVHIDLLDWQDTNQGIRSQRSQKPKGKLKTSHCFC